MKNYTQTNIVASTTHRGAHGLAMQLPFRLAYLGLLVAFLLLARAAGKASSSQELRYTLAPVVNGNFWNSNLGLQDGLMYGGKLGIDFGRSIGLEASYLTSGKLWTDFARVNLLDTSGALIQEQRVTVRRFGGDLLIRWPSDRFAPFAKIGGGIVRFEPQSGATVEKIDVRVGGGLDYVLNRRMRTRVWGELSRFRLDRYSLAPGGAINGSYPLDDQSDKVRNNVSIGLSIDYALGQSRFSKRETRDELHPFSALEVEPLIGRLNFDDDLISTTTVLGGRLGGELNPWVGWGVYYWHAMESDLGDTKPLQSYGGEARFGLGSKSGPQPYLTIGAGQLDFRSGFVDHEGNPREDKTAFILGGGIRAEILRGLQINIAARDYMFSQGRLDRFSGTEELRHNWMISGALVFGIGGKGGPSKVRPASPALPISPMQSSAPRKDSVDNSTATVMVRDTVLMAAQTATVGTTGNTRSYVSDKSITIPIPLEGEVYIRYGTPSTQSQGAAITPGVTVPAVVDTTKSPTSAKPVSTTTPAVDSIKTAPVAEATLTRTELDSLLQQFRVDISSLLTTNALSAPTVQPTADTTNVSFVRDSALTALREELARSQEERLRLDSLIRQSEATSLRKDSLAEARLQQAISESVSAALATRPESSDRPMTQADVAAMMAALSSRLDSTSARRAAADSARLSDQLNLEVIRQTKSQEEFQRAMSDFALRYGTQQTSPPSVVITQPTPLPPRPEPSTVVIRPDTQFVVLRDSLGQQLTGPVALTEGRSVTSGPPKDFIDLRPTAYTGFGLEYPRQFVLGSRLDIGPITVKDDRLRLVPEFAMGFGGGGVSIMAVINAEYRIVDVESGDYRLVPYVRVGFGVLGFGGDIVERDTEGVMNLTYGFSIDPRRSGLLRGVGNPAFFFEHQIIDLFDLNRVVVGFQWSR